MRVLFCGEYSQNHTGYSVYANTLLHGLSKKFEIAELATNLHKDDPKQFNVPWKVYPVEPASTPLEKMGGGIFNDVLLEWKPTHVLAYRDIWYDSYQCYSPLRDYYAHIIMPAIDAQPQNKSWISLYNSADKILGYTNWGLNLLRDFGLTNTFKTASPVAHSSYKAIPKEIKLKLQSSLGLGKINIIGTVMRNQLRKLFPELFRDFAEFLKRSGRKDIYLLCHTSSPDTFLFDELLIEHGITDKVLFTYFCKSCGAVDISQYKGDRAFCPKCRQPNLGFPSSSEAVPYEVMSEIYGMMDLYVQYAGLEGYGIPLAEAIRCKIPIMAVDYSAMSEIVHTAEGIPIKPIAFENEVATGRLWAVPDSNDFVGKLDWFFSLSESQRESRANLSYSILGTRTEEEIVNVWSEAILSTKPKKAWDAPITIRNKQVFPFKTAVDNKTFARWLITSVLQKPELRGSLLEARLIRDLNNGFTVPGVNGRYFFEEINGGSNFRPPWNQQLAYEHFLFLANEMNDWEVKRINSL